MARENGDPTAPVTIKKYANRRLYNTATSSYVTLDDLCQMVKEGIDFVVYDAKSGDDITRPVLTQIIVEEENKGQNLLPINFLRQLIAFYGDSLQAVVPGYLEQSMEAFSHNQERMRSYIQEAFDGIFPFGSFEEMGRQNMAMFERTMKMFANPYTGKDPGGAEDGTSTESTNGPSGDDLKQLKAQIDALQDQLQKLSDKK
ncbi:MAG: polyhydroxyalkanoate synthesis repressor PhaR [Alphaproteobacteria bacterium]|nr:polyhydroxyalkanoate synthesis repressor PhaR [Alphaproteobacteria bacterium]